MRLAADSDLGPAGTVVGTSSLAEWDLENEGVHLGWTAYGPRWWGTTVNPACKLALLSHAFDDCGFGRVKLQTDLVNTRSQAAIAQARRDPRGRAAPRTSAGPTARGGTRWCSRSWSTSGPAVRAGLEARLGGPA